MLLGAALLFWGWQTGLLLPSAIMAIVLEGARWLKVRWEFSNDDFVRIWTFCTVVLLAAAIYAFTSSSGPSDFRGFFENPNAMTQRNAGTATARAAMTLFRELPMIFFPFIAAETYSSRPGVPLETISLILRWRWKRARKLGQPPPPSRYVDMSYPFFILALFSASAHAAEDSRFFWGLSVLVAWSLWPHRSKRFGLGVWSTSFGLVIVLGYFGQTGMGHLQNYLSNLNADWLAGFGRRAFDPSRSRELAKLGRVKLSGRIVIRLETKEGVAPSLLREASYWHYDHQTWSAEVTERDFEHINEETNQGTFMLLREKTNFLRAATIGCYLEGGKALLPLPEGVGRLEHLMAFELQKSAYGAVLASGPGLVLFDAFYGPGGTIDAPASRVNDLEVPMRETNALAQVVAELGIKGQSLAQALNTLSRYFQQNFTYSTWYDGRPRETLYKDPLLDFLLHSHKGHCEYFATAGVLLLRAAGIPARYAVGYAVHERSGHKYVIRQRDGHAWCMVWDAAAQRWREFDPTPAGWIQAEESHASLFEGISDLWSRVVFEFSKFRWGQSSLRQYFLWSAAPVLAVLLYQIVFRRWQRGEAERDKTAQDATTWPGLDSEFFELENKLIGLGFPRQASEPLSEWLRRAASAPALGDVSTPLRELLALHYRHRFDPRGLSSHERERLRHEASACLQRIQQDSAPALPLAQAQ
jgi:hypothetical protein